MFIDLVEIKVSSGNGGAGCSSFRREKFVAKGGPDGGDGGRGGDVFFLIDENLHTLSKFRGKKNLEAGNGAPGKSSNMNGEKGKDLFIKVPPGTQVINNDTNELLLDLTNLDKTLFLKGGLGGLGNARFKSSTNQKPKYSQKGISGESFNLRLELKLIADIGLVGLPNVGKSTLISVISNAKPQIANYEFTTIIPKLGKVYLDNFKEFVIADIPGLIEGANEGKGLGINFLRHIQRTKTLLFMIDLNSYRDFKYQYSTLRKELLKFNEELYLKKYAIALTKTDILSRDELEEKVDIFLKDLGFISNKSNRYKIKEDFPYYVQDIDNFSRKDPFFIVPISSLNKDNIQALIYMLYDLIQI